MTDENNFRKNLSLFNPLRDLDDYETEDLAYEDRLETEAAWEAAFEAGEQLARDTAYDLEEDW